MFSCSDDKSISRWSADSLCQGKVAALNMFVSDISWLPIVSNNASGNAASKLSSSDIFAISCTDGTFRFLSRSGREEKKVAAHEGAVIVIRWSHDGSALLTAGEDGELKIWSKTGNLRSTLASTGEAIYASCWGPDDDQVLLSSGNTLMIKSIQVKRKNIQWNAHEGIVLCADWNITNGFIVSGGEDCTYRVWDSFGRQLYASRPIDHIITSVGWNPNGECFAVGSYNLLRLCDKIGWVHCRERLQTGSVMRIAWTSDGTQLAGGCGNGSIVFAQIVDRIFEWKNIQVKVLETRKIRVTDVAKEILEDIEYARDRIVEIGVGFDHLVVSTTSQCFIYSLNNLNTPTIFDIRAPCHFIHLCKSHFLTLDLLSGIQIMNYDGKVISSPKFQGLRVEFVNKDMIALSPDTVAVVDTVDTKCIHVIDAFSDRLITKVTHSAEVSNIAFNQHILNPQERLLIFADRNRDLYIMYPYSTIITILKLHSHVESFCFNDETDTLVGLADGRLNVWYCPQIVLIDKDLLPQTTFSMDTLDYGYNSQIISYTSNCISIRKIDGSIIYHSTSIDIPILYDLIRNNHWDETIRLCRYQKNSYLWATLASHAIAKKELDAAEIALCELNEIPKVS